MTISEYNLHNYFVRPWPLILWAGFGYHGSRRWPLIIRTGFGHHGIFLSSFVILR